jgi:hypothetical protein
MAAGARAFRLIIGGVEEADTAVDADVGIDVEAAANAAIDVGTGATTGTTGRHLRARVSASELAP